MNHRLIGRICLVSGATVWVLGLIPAALLLNPWRKANPVDQSESWYFTFNLLKTCLIALAGVVAGFLLVRLGLRVKSKAGR